jgi:hypothetical protein
MATTTTNFGWDIPQSTDLVKDGATAIAALGQDIDTALIDLKGGTTGQVLAKASATDLDFSWVAQDDSNAIQNAIVDAKGDLIAATAADTPARLAVGTNGQVLTADSTAATGLIWATATTGTKIGQVVSATTTTRTATSSTSYVDATNLTASITPTSATSKILVLVTAPFYFYRTSGDTAAGSVQIVRGATAIYDDKEAHYISSSSLANIYMNDLWTASYVDSPATTSATTYKIQIKARSGTTGVAINENTSSVSTIILCEVIA